MILPATLTALDRTSSRSRMTWCGRAAPLLLTVLSSAFRTRMSDRGVVSEERVERADEHVEDGSRSARDEIERIVRSATTWTAAGVLAPAVGLGPLLASGWRPVVLPIDLAILWWFGVVVACVGLGLLIWAGCPALGTGLESAYRQKMQSVRFGIVLNVVGMAIVGLAVLLGPSTGQPG
jgi:uncharacterized membrane-anchored protein YitT (DUF2179 family)